jgi:hypothetical protein
MSYNDSAFYVAETNRKNRLKAPLKPFIGIISGRNGPLIIRFLHHFGEKLISTWETKIDR